MSVLTVIRWARQQRTGDKIAKAVLMVIASHTDRDGIAVLSARTIAAEAEIDESTVRKQAVPVLVAAGLLEYRPGRGKARSRYQLLVGEVRARDSDPGPRAPRSAGRMPAQDSLFSEGPTPRTTESPSAGPAEPSAGSAPRSAGWHVSDQHKQSTEVEEEVEEEEAAPPLRAPATRPRTRGSGGEHVPPAELHRTATGGRAFVIVSAWAEQNPGVRNGARRRLAVAVDHLLRERADPELIPAALDAAHGGRWRSPEAALPHAYDDVRRHAHPPTARGQPVNANDAAIHDFLTRTPEPRAIGGSP